MSGSAFAVSGTYLKAVHRAGLRVALPSGGPKESSPSAESPRVDVRSPARRRLRTKAARTATEPATGGLGGASTNGGGSANGGSSSERRLQRERPAPALPAKASSGSGGTVTNGSGGVMSSGTGGDAGPAPPEGRPAPAGRLSGRTGGASSEGASAGTGERGTGGGMVTSPGDPGAHDVLFTIDTTAGPAPAHLAVHLRDQPGEPDGRGEGADADAGGGQPHDRVQLGDQRLQRGLGLHVRERRRTSARARPRAIR